MRKMNEYTGRPVHVQEVQNIWRTSDSCLYTVYKDGCGNYYMDAYDASPSVAQLNGSFESDTEAVKFAQEQLDEEREEE